VRTWITPVVLTLAAGWLTAAGQPEPPKGPPPIVIQPKKPGDPPAETIPDRPGVIIIRPRSQPSPATPAPAQPGPPATVTAPPAAPPTAPQKEPGLLFDYWFAAAVEGDRIGYLHWTGKQVEQKGHTFWVGTKYQHFTVARFGQVVTQWGEESTTEVPDGGVLVTSMRQGLGKDQALALTGIVEGNTLKIRGEGVAAGARDTPWPGGVVGIAREPRLFQEKSLKPGESFDYLTYVPQVNRVVKTTTTLEAAEAASLWPNTPPRKLLRFVSRMEPVGTFKLPAATVWVDAASVEPLKVEFDFPGLGGRVTFLRTTKEAATAPVGKVPDLFNVQSIRLDREIPGIHTRGAVVYKVVMPRDDEPGTAFPSDDRQQARNLDETAKSLELTVAGMWGPSNGAKPLPAPGPEFTESNYFINWDNPGVKGHAAKALAGLPPTATTWEKARAVERWVNRNMRAVEFSQAMATADNVARTLSGDCTEYAMLAAAMCRAAGVPSRTVLGLVYTVGRDGKPFLAYHMWFEVYTDGQWVPLDATLGQGGIGPGHIKIADHSWHDEKSFAPLLPVLRVLMAKPTVEVVKVGP
jgi:predicted transglutaminase-like cysteine proteinase